jgi:hypothetical protein
MERRWHRGGVQEGFPLYKESQGLTAIPLGPLKDTIQLS